jgi:hypothetical protein
MNVVERRKIMCSVAFNLIAVTCVLWSFYVLIEKTREEVKMGKLREYSEITDQQVQPESRLFRMVILDETNRCSYWIYRRIGRSIFGRKWPLSDRTLLGISLCSMQNVLAGNCETLKSSDLHFDICSSAFVGDSSINV